MGSVPASGRFPWRRAWQPTPVFLPREPHGQRSLVGYSSWCYKRVRHNLATNQQQKQHKWLEVLLEFCRKFLIYSKPQTFLFLKPTHTYTHTPPHINCCCHVAQLCLTLCNPVDCRTPGRLPCPSPSPRVRFNSSLLSQWCHPTISSSVNLPMSWLFPSGGQSTGASAPIFRVDFLWDCPATVWSACCPRDSQKSSPTPQLRASVLWPSVFFMVQLSHPYMTTWESAVKCFHRLLLTSYSQ